MPDIYDIDFSIQQENLNVPTKRLPKISGFLISLLKALQWLRDRTHDDYTDGTNYPDWSSMAGYPYGTLVRYADKAIYECINVNGAAGNQQAPGNTAYWFKTQDNFIGSRERAKYNGQLIKLEYQLNKWFSIAPGNPQIYIGTNTNPTTFLMGDSGGYSSTMPNDSMFSSSYMGNAPSFTTTDFTVYVPLAVYNALGANNATREQAVRSFVDKYRLAGIIYNVTTY